MRVLLSVLLLIISVCASAQHLFGESRSLLQKDEDSLKEYSWRMITDKVPARRFIADSVFIRNLVKSLKTPNSFYYPFDSLQTISRLYAPDSSFRIFSWQMARDENYYRQRGAIQMNTADGSLKLFPLLDVSDFTNDPDDSARGSQNWIGAIYYNIIMKTFEGKKYYTLLGFDDNNMRSSKKWIDVLSFDEGGKPVFGSRFVTAAEDSARPGGTHARFCLEYKKDGAAKMNYDKELDLIMYDHLVSENNEPGNTASYVPDGDYQGFRWVNGSWAQVDKVFDYKLQDGQAPVPAPLKDATGSSDETRLLEQSQKTLNKQQKATQPPTKKPVRKN